MYPEKPLLILKRASKNRESGQWPDVDYDVFDADKNIGRIYFGGLKSLDMLSLNNLLARPKLETQDVRDICVDQNKAR